MEVNFKQYSTCSTSGLSWVNLYYNNNNYYHQDDDDYDDDDDDYQEM